MENGPIICHCDRLNGPCTCYPDIKEHKPVIINKESKLLDKIIQVEINRYKRKHK